MHEKVGAGDTATDACRQGSRTPECPLSHFDSEYKRLLSNGLPTIGPRGKRKSAGRFSILHKLWCFEVARLVSLSVAKLRSFRFSTLLHSVNARSLFPDLTDEMNMPDCLQNSIRNAQFVVLMALGVGLVGSSVADDGTASSERQITKIENRKVVNAVKRYARSISCDFKVSPKKIAALVPYNSDDAKLGKKYVALWDGDIGCAGGPGNYLTHIAVVIETRISR